MEQFEQFNLAINMNIYINVNLQQKDKATKIKEIYSELQQNIDTDVYNNRQVSEKVNSIIVNYKSLYEENFNFFVPNYQLGYLTHNYNNTNEYVKDTLQTGLGLLKVFKKYLEENLINDKIFNSFSSLLNEKINSLSIPRDKDQMNEEICIYEILKNNGLSKNVYEYEGPIPHHLSDDNFFNETELNEFCSKHFQKVLDTLHKKELRNPRKINQLYLSLITQYNEILNIKDKKEQILLGNVKKD